MIDRAEPPDRGPVAEALLECEAGALVGQAVPVDAAAAHVEVERPGVADLGVADAAGLDAVDGLAGRARVGEGAEVALLPLGGRAGQDQRRGCESGKGSGHVVFLFVFDARGGSSLPGGGVLGL